MAEVSDIAVYQKLSELADELDQMASQGATVVGEVALNTAAKTVRGMASAVYRHIMSTDDEILDS
jgi:ubiquinone biosynthesis protein UbiJ